MSIKSFFSNIIVRNLLLLVLMCFLLLGGVLYWLDSYTMHNQAIIVPDVKGALPEEAAPLLKKKHLRFQIVDSVYMRGQKPGVIVEQIPAAASKVKENRIVFLTINANNAQTVELPDMIDISQRQAKASLRALGFVVDSVRYVPSEYPDLVKDVFYNDRSVRSGQRLPYGSELDRKSGV